MTGAPRRAHSAVFPRALAAVLLVPLLVLLALATPAAAQTPAWVDTGGDCLWMRSAPGLDAPEIRCLDHGEPITLLDDEEARDGFTWRAIEHDGDQGWVADFYITTDEASVQQLYEPAEAGAGGMPAPPPGGLTMGATDVADPAALVASLPFEVEDVWHFDVPAQALRHYIPGAPAFASTLTSLEPGDVVLVRRAGTLPADLGEPPEAPLTVAGSPNELPVPPVGGLTFGVAGNTDPRFVAMAQPFTVESIAYFHVPSQQWLVYVPDAPSAVNTLHQGHLRVDSVVLVRRGPDAPRAPSADNSDRFEASITYYYCVPGDNPASIGDAGGYCGTMANGERVHEGAAACASRHLGQRFRIEGDPTERIYTCTDTGGSVLHDHRDVWFQNSDDGYDWWLEVGERAIVEIVHDD